MPVGDLLQARHLLLHCGREHGHPDPTLCGEQEKQILGYPWHGNIREPENVIERAVILASGFGLDLNLSPPGDAVGLKSFDGMPSLEEIPRRSIRHAPDFAKGRMAGPGGAAEILGMRRSSLYSRMDALGMRKSNG